MVKEGSMERNQKNKMNILGLLATLIFLVAFAIYLLTPSGAKYVLTDSISINFSSYYMDVISPDITGFGTFPIETSFTVNNNDGTNYMTEDLEYTITIQESTKWNMVVTGGVTRVISGESINSDELLVTITPKNGAILEETETITIVLTVTAPYPDTKTIKLTYSEYISNYVQNGLVLLYDGFNNTGTGHESGSTVWKDLIGSNDGQLIGNPTWNKNYLEFDGIDDKVKFTGTIPSRYTIVSTFYYDSSSKQSYPRIYSAPVNVQSFPTLYIAANGTLAFYGHGIDTSFVSSEFSGIIQTSVTYDGTYMSLYINGKFISKLQSKQNPTSVIDAYLGGREDLLRQFKGKIYNFMIYDRVLTSDEIEENYSEDYSIKIDSNIIPITTVAQLMKIGSNEITEIDGKYYQFLKDSIYEVKNDLSFSYAGIWEPDLIGNGRINTYGNVITITNTLDNQEYYYQNQLYVTADNAIADGLVLHYDSINNTGVGHNNTSPIWKDLHGNNDGTLTNGVTWENNSLAFDGIDDKVTYTGAITNNYSMVITINPELTGMHPRFVAENPFPSIYMNSNNAYKLSFYGQGKDTTFSPTTTPPEAVSTYIVVTYNGANVNLYVNGVKIGTIETTTLPTAATTAYLGGNGTTTRQYTGKIYDFMIYNRALTEFEIERSYLTNMSKYGE